MVAGRRIIRFSEDVLEDLSAFTGISKDKIIDYFDKSRVDNTKYELFEIVRPETRETLVWYYRVARAEFVHNATKYHDLPQGRRGWPLLKKWIKPDMEVLDYGAGTGQNCIHIYQDLKAVPHYFEISIIQKEFFKFRCIKRNCDIHIIEPYTIFSEEIRFDPIESIGYGHYDIICLSQVLEHIVCPQKLLERLVECLKNNGLLLEDTPFGSHDFQDLKSLTKDEFEQVMNGLSMEKIEHGVWKKKIGMESKF